MTNCVFHGTDCGIRIKSQRGRGGVIEGISFSNIVMQDVPHPFVITTFYMGKDKPGEVLSGDRMNPPAAIYLSPMSLFAARPTLAPSPACVKCLSQTLLSATYTFVPATAFRARMPPASVSGTASLKRKTTRAF